MKKKVLSLVLALLMTASAASTVLADDVVAIAEDTAVEAVAVDEEVEAGQYDKAIEFLANYKIFKGYSADDTGAEDLIQRYQMALFVARIATGWTEDEVWEDGPENWSEFSDIDVDPVNKYFGALSFANQKGIIEGYGNGKFGPTDGITYQNALTMVVRTLGYDTLDWPWGYIQKAVELGLTDGITGVAYQDELTRGEVAQIIYNTLFAKMKDGSNLALKNFGIEFGWEKVVITASNINSFTKLADDKGTGVEKNLVEFKLLNDDGTLGDDAYRALASDFDLDYEAHEDDLAVGNAYYVLFEKDADSALTEIVAVEDLYIDTLENTGKLNDYEIKEFFDKYALVEKYSANSYINVTSSTKNEVLVWDKVDGITEDVVDGYKIAIDWNTGNILAPKVKDGKLVDKDEDGDIDTDDYEIRWYRWTKDGENERYYEIKTDDKDNPLGINWMTKEDFEKFYESIANKVNTKFKGFKQLTSYANTAYATLDLFDTNLDGVADRGLYEKYGIGYFSNTTEKCGKCDKEYATWTLSPVGTAEKYVKETPAPTELWIEGTCDHQSHAWFVEGYTPVVDEDGEYEDGYVIYSYDAETGAIKVVKNIVDVEDTDDENSYVATGVLRAYKTKDEAVTIGEDKLTMNYDELIGTGFYKVSDNKTKYDGLLRAYFNQFVKYVVVDGELVHIELAGKPAVDELIVLDSYKGISADGYIVVNGYSTTDLDYAEFRLGSVDGWKRGDAYYNEDKYEFDYGVYKVVSYDKDEDAYFVEWVDLDEYDEKFTKFSTDQSGDSYMTVETGFNYKTNEFADKSFAKMSKDDEWILVKEFNRFGAVITVYTGKLPDGAWITGDLVWDKDGTRILVGVDWNSAMAAVLDSYKAGVVVLLEDLQDFDSMDYNGEYAEDDRYILGGVEYAGRAYNILTGSETTVTAFNDEAEHGYAYYTEDGVLADVDEERMLFSDDIVAMINNLFSEETYSAKAFNNIYYDWTNDGTLANDSKTTIKVGEDKDGEDVYFEDLFVKGDKKNDKYDNQRAVEAMILNYVGEIDGSSKYLTNVDEVKYRVIKIEDEGVKRPDIKITKIDEVKTDDAAAKLAKYAKNGYTELDAFYVWDAANRDIVIYIVENEAEDVITKKDTITVKANDNGKTALGTTMYDDNNDNDTTDIVLQENAAGVDGANVILTDVKFDAYYENDVLKGVALKSAKVTFDGKVLEDNCQLHVDKGIHFGTKGLTKYADENCKTDLFTAYADYVDVATPDVYALANTTATDDTDGVVEKEWDTTCNLIKSYTVTLDNSDLDATDYVLGTKTVNLYIPYDTDGDYYQVEITFEAQEYKTIAGERVENIVIINDAVLYVNNAN